MSKALINPPIDINFLLKPIDFIDLKRGHFLFNYSTSYYQMRIISEANIKDE